MGERSPLPRSSWLDIVSAPMLTCSKAQMPARRAACLFGVQLIITTFSESNQRIVNANAVS